MGFPTLLKSHNFLILLWFCHSPGCCGLLPVQEVAESPGSSVQLCLAALQAATSLLALSSFLVLKGTNQILSSHQNPSFPVVFEPLIFGFGDPLELLALLLSSLFSPCPWMQFFSVAVCSARRGRKSHAALVVLPSAFSLQIKCSLVSNFNLLLSNCHLNQKSSASPFLSLMLAGLKVNYSEL